MVQLLNDLVKTSELSKKYNTPLANIILKKIQSKNVDEAHENQEDFKKTASTAS